MGSKTSLTGNLLSYLTTSSEPPNPQATLLERLLVFLRFLFSQAPPRTSYRTSTPAVWAKGSVPLLEGEEKGSKKMVVQPFFVSFALITHQTKRQISFETFCRYLVHWIVLAPSLSLYQLAPFQKPDSNMCWELLQLMIALISNQFVKPLLLKLIVRMLIHALNSSKSSPHRSHAIASALRLCVWILHDDDQVKND